jgi:hypothetical protein
VWAENLADVAPVVVAVVVPWLTFRYALRQDQRRWVRDQRAQVYVDLLVEASAENEWLMYELTARDAVDDGHAFDAPKQPEDHRLPDLERRRLGARALAYGSREVVRRHNVLSREGLWALMAPDKARRHQARWRAEVAFSDLQSQIRRELETEHDTTWWWLRRTATERAVPKSPPWSAYGREQRPVEPEADWQMPDHPDTSPGEDSAGDRRGATAE